MNGVNGRDECAKYVSEGEVHVRTMEAVGSGIGHAGESI